MDQPRGEVGGNIPPPDYEGQISRRWRENSDAVGKLLSDDEKVRRYFDGAKDRGGSKSNEFRNLMEKISVFSSNFGYSISDIIDEIQSNRFFRSTFAVDPRRQSIDESIAYDWLKQIALIENLEKLPGQGSNALYIGKDGTVRSGSEFTQKETKPSKSLDFRWSAAGYSFFAMHKRTVGEGGAQDNSGREVRRVVDYFREDERGEVNLVLILDGGYWDIGRRDELREYVDRRVPNCLVGSIQEIPILLAAYCK